MKIYYRGVYRLMAKEAADCIKVGTLVEEVGCKGVTKRMDGAGFSYIGFFFVCMKTFLAAA